MHTVHYAHLILALKICRKKLINVYDTHKLLGKKLKLAVQPLNVNNINCSVLEQVFSAKEILERFHCFNFNRVENMLMIHNDLSHVTFYVFPLVNTNSKELNT